MLIIGLGNPKEYNGTRHSIGKELLMSFVVKHGGSFTAHGLLHKASVCIGGKEIVCIVSEGYMNTTGQDIAHELKKYKPEEIVVAFDDIYFPEGVIKMNIGGGAAGHNGVKSMIEALQSEGFYRIRIGIGRGESIADFVLEKFTSIQTETIKKTWNAKMETVSAYIAAGDMNKAMQACNAGSPVLQKKKTLYRTLRKHAYIALSKLKKKNKQ